ncbi:activating transcription factor 7-interacting protein 2 [Tenrec ecaudatus]|uniref:activating transcription factor 7-interacting protein 2 n=1 Tax=Tenrec ecaudatus TaxID=94439 RepID=UPI003F598FB0
MASPDESNRKILKAKKTMPPSCRKQVELMNKLKIVEPLKTTTVGKNVPSGNQNLGTAVKQNKCGHSENDLLSLDYCKYLVCSQKSNGFPLNLLESVEKNVDSETRLDYIDGLVSPYQKSGKTVYSLKKLIIEEAKNSQNTSVNHFGSQANIIRSTIERHEGDCHLKCFCCSPNVLRGVVQEPKYTLVSTLNGQGHDKMVSYLETDSQLDFLDGKPNNNLDSDSWFEPVGQTPNLMNSVNAINCAADGLKTEECSTPCHSSISGCGSTDSPCHPFLDIESNNGHNLKKRMFSENKENVKRVKMSVQNNGTVSVAQEKQRTLLEQVQHLIRQEVDSVNYKIFDNKLKELNERIGKTQCRSKHEAIANELFAKVAKLQRRIKTLLSQRNCLEANILSSNVACKGVNSGNMILDKKQESLNGVDERLILLNSEHSNPSEKATKKFDLSKDHIELVSGSNNDDVIFISVESPILTASITTNQTDIIIKSKNSNAPDADVDDVKRKFDSVVHFTKEGRPNCNTESPVSSLESPSKAVLNSKETTAVAQIAAQVPESFEHLPPLPEPPSLQPELVDKLRETLPPQKPELRVKRVLKPRGFALTWNITKINPKCAPVESYHLFLCHGNSKDKLFWKKIGEIKALPLPMACTLSEFLFSKKYYFTVQSKDIFGRYGPFCDIKAVPGFSENLP